MISGTMKPASANLSMIDVTSSIRIQSTKKRLYDNVKLYLGEGGGGRNSVIQSGAGRWGTAVGNLRFGAPEQLAVPIAAERWTVSI